MKNHNSIGIIIGGIILIILVGVDVIRKYNRVNDESTTFCMPNYSFRIINVNDLKIKTLYQKENNAIINFSNGNEDALLFVMKSSTQDDSNDSRINYNFVQTLDTVIFNLDGYEREKVINNVFSYKTIKQYSSSNGKKAITTTIFARKRAYVFFQVYDSVPYLHQRLLDSFRNSRTLCLENVFAMWRDRLSGDSSGWSNFFGGVMALIRLFWCFFIIWLCYLFLSKLKIGWYRLIFFIPTLMVFVYVVFYDSFMDWIMGFGSLGGVLMDFFSLFIDILGIIL